jgi:decaprenyl-phosphate phosphoribosyltransferase
MKIQSVQNKDMMMGGAVIGGAATRSTTLTRVRAYVNLIRVRQWVKNLFLFIPSFFAGHLFHTSELFHVLQGALAFCLVSSGVYILNDYRDREVDRLHPRKKLRALASGEISPTTGLIVMTFLIVAGLAWAVALDYAFAILIVSYLILNLAYSFGLKNVPIVDLFVVSLGFLIRVYAGGVLAGLSITHWLSMMILLLSLFLIIAKRRDDLLVNAENNCIVRKTSKAYNLEYINSCVTLLSAVMVVAYVMYTLSPEVTERFQSDYLFITTIFVIAGIMRYLQITFVEQRSGSPTNIFVKDKFILFTIAGWIISFYIIIYAG